MFPSLSLLPPRSWMVMDGEGVSVGEVEGVVEVADSFDDSAINWYIQSKRKILQSATKLSNKFCSQRISVKAYPVLSS